MVRKACVMQVDPDRHEAYRLRHNPDHSPASKDLQEVFHLAAD